MFKIFNCDLYLSKQEKNVLRKEIELISSKVNCTYKDKTELLRPSIILDFSDNLLKANYVYLSDKHRYYFIEKIENLAGGKIMFLLSVDALVSNQTEILNITSTITRNEFLKNAYLNDSEYNINAYEQIVAKVFPNGLQNDSVILMTAG